MHAVVALPGNDLTSLERRSMAMRQLSKVAADLPMHLWGVRSVYRRAE
jgi:hypothetical protein